MTTEQKAKRFDEALERARDYYKANLMLYNADENAVLEDIFSELAESEDERIRKALIKVFSNREKYLIDQSFGDITVSEALAWLEKQGDQKPKWTEEDEHHWMMCIECVKECATQERENFSKTIDWLKSLKQRMEK